MDYFQSIVLGIIQGATEFIPVSSSGHLELVPKLFKWNDPSTSYILFLHLGTLLALFWYFRPLIFKYLSVLLKFGKALFSKQEVNLEERRDLRIIQNIILATIPAGILGIILEETITNFYDLNSDQKIVTLAVVIPMALLGVVFILSDRFFKHRDKDLGDLKPKNSLIIGLSQSLAFVRGVSRSGITLLVGQLNGLSRVSAAEFSFLMSMPIVFATSIFGIKDLLDKGLETFNNEIGFSLVGMIAAFISGLFAIKFLLRFLKNSGLKVFGWYRVIFALFVVLFLVL